MRVLDAIRQKEPVHIERKYLDVRDSGDDSHPVIQDIEEWIRKAAASDSLFSEVGAPWSSNRKDASLAQLHLNGHVLLDLLDGAGTAPTSTPRPYIHPVRTLAGVEVTATHPADHDWHCGVGFAVPDVDGTSFWGGGTYIHGQGYVLLDNHGKIESKELNPVSTRSESEENPGFDHHTVWTNHDGREVIHELQTIRISLLDIGKSEQSPSWRFHFSTDLKAVDGPASLGSPGSNGRIGGGYGGFFWRLPRCTNVNIFSENAEGEDAVHGSVAPWIAWTARFEAHPGVCGTATLVFVPADPVSAQDPWIVRCAGYPGVGSAVAWDKRVEIPGGETIRRSFTVAVVDGTRDRDGCAAIAALLKSSPI